MNTSRDKDLVNEIQMLRSEVKQLKEMVNMLVDIVVDLGEEVEEFEGDLDMPFPGRNGKMSLCM